MVAGVLHSNIKFWPKVTHPFQKRQLLTFVVLVFDLTDWGGKIYLSLIEEWYFLTLVSFRQHSAKKYAFLHPQDTNGSIHDQCIKMYITWNDSILLCSMDISVVIVLILRDHFNICCRICCLNSLYITTLVVYHILSSSAIDGLADA